MNHLYLNRAMVASAPLYYLGKELAPGEPFSATDADADYFVSRGKAADAPVKAAAQVPTPAPTPSPAPAPAPPEEAAAQKASDGLTVAQIKAELTARGIEFPSGFVPKDKLAALLDGAADA